MQTIASCWDILSNSCSSLRLIKLREGLDILQCLVVHAFLVLEVQIATDANENIRGIWSRLLGWPMFKKVADFGDEQTTGVVELCCTQQLAS